MTKETKKLGDDVVIRMSMSSETERWDHRLRLDIDVKSGDRKHSFSRISEELDYHKYSPEYTPEEILDITVKSMWYAANRNLQRILSQWGFLPDNPEDIEEE